MTGEERAIYAGLERDIADAVQRCRDRLSAVRADSEPSSSSRASAGPPTRPEDGPGAAIAAGVDEIRRRSR